MFELVNEVLEDRRWYYAFRDIEHLRDQMLASRVELDFVDFGAGSSGDEKSRTGTKRRVSVRDLVLRAASSPAQGRTLFRLANRLAPKTMLELGTSVGLGAMYLASAVRSAKLISLEADPECARIARINLDALQLKNAVVITGPFEETLSKALEQLQNVDFVFIDGNHRAGPTLSYFEACLPYVRDETVFVFDDIYWSPDMKNAWRRIQEHARVTRTVDFFDLSLAFVNPEFMEKQHFRIIRTALKPWKVF